MPTLSLSNEVGAVANLTQQTNETSTPLAANGVFNGATQDTGNNAGGGVGWSRFRAMAYTDQAGTLNIQQSRDGSVWRTTVSQAVTASTATIIESIITRRYVRVSYTNGATLQTVFELDSCLVAI